MEDNKAVQDPLTPDFSAASRDERLAQLSETLKKKVLGQQEAVDAILAQVKGHVPKSPLTPQLLFGSPGISKKEWAKRMTEAAMNAPKDNSGVIFIDEPHKMSAEEFGDALDKAMGRPTRHELGDQAAKACRDGVAVTPMKKLTLRRGFTYI